MRKLVSTALGLAALGSTMQGCSHSSYTSRDINQVSNESLDRMRDSPKVAYDASQVRAQATPYKMAQEVAKGLPETEFSLFYQDQGQLVKLKVDTHGAPNRSLDELVSLQDKLPENFKARVLRLGAPDKNMLASRSAGNQISRDTGLKAVASYDGKPYDIAVKKVTGVVDWNRATCYRFLINFGTPDLTQTMKVFDPLMGWDIAVTGASVYGMSGVWQAGASSPGGMILDGIVARIEGGGSNAPNGTWQRTVDLGANKDQKSAGLRWATSQVEEFDATNIIMAPRGLIYTEGAHNIKINPNSVEFDVISTNGNLIETTLYGIATNAPGAIGTRFAVKAAKDCRDTESNQSDSSGQNNAGNQTNPNNGNNCGENGPGNPTVSGVSIPSSGGGPSQVPTTPSGGSTPSSGGTK